MWPAVKANWPALKPRGTLHFVNPPQSPPLLLLANATSPSLTVLYKVSSVGQNYRLFYPRYLKLCLASRGELLCGCSCLPGSAQPPLKNTFNNQIQTLLGWITHFLGNMDALCLADTSTSPPSRYFIFPQPGKYQPCQSFFGSHTHTHFFDSAENPLCGDVVHSSWLS